MMLLEQLVMERKNSKKRRTNFTHEKESAGSVVKGGHVYVRQCYKSGHAVNKWQPRQSVLR